MQLVLISGLSGSGKSIALKALADSGYYCVDNLPVQLLQQSTELLHRAGHERVAMSIDARTGDSLEQVPGYIAALKNQGVDLRLFFLDTKNDTLIKRFSETRRRHPLATGTRTLEECLTRERELLAPIGEIGQRLDTSDLLPNTLRNWIKDLLEIQTESVMLLFESFSYKQGIPLDADLIFDVRCLPNPHYDPRLRPLSGLDAPVIDFLEKEPKVGSMFEDIRRFVETWLPSYGQDNRSSLTVAVGCTGGRHRSVYFVERLSAYFRSRSPVLVRHRHLSSAS
ncbi:MAG TPA: RNase adapter RapZ [Burkholderiales bacterium]|nr:RNase adapter RapZ [Burkholderiales bacterium]